MHPPLAVQQKSSVQDESVWIAGGDDTRSLDIQIRNGWSDVTDPHILKRDLSAEIHFVIARAARPVTLGAIHVEECPGMLREGRCRIIGSRKRRKEFAKLGEFVRCRRQKSPFALDVA